MWAMTVIDRFRSATADETGDQRPELAALGRGALTAAATWVVVTSLVLTAVLLSGGGAPVGSTIGAGSAVWLALGGARLGLGTATIALVPLLALALLVWAARAGARRALREVEGSPFAVELTWRERVVQPRTRVAGAWMAGYALAALAAWGASLTGPFDVRPLSLLLPVLLVPLLGLVLGDDEVGAGLLGVLPVALRRAVVPGLRTAGALVLAGSLLVVVMVVVHLSRVLHVHSELDAGVAGGALLAALQVLALPNLGLWGLGWLAGPGFSVSLGAETTWAESQTALLPMVPVLAAHPEPGALPWVARLSVLVPVLLGAWLARQSLARISRLSRTVDKAAVVGCAVVVAAVAVALLDAVAGGSLGSERLARIGVPAPRLALALVVDLGIGAALVLAHDWWRLRR